MWITLIVFMVLVALTLTLTSSIYNKYIEKKTNSNSTSLKLYFIVENILLTIANITSHSIVTITNSNIFAIIYKIQ